MLKQLKWDAIDIWKRYGWTFLVIPLVLSLSLIPIDKQTAIDVMLEAMIIAGCGAGILYLIILPNLIITSWLNGNQAQLAFTIPVNIWKMLASKLILAAILNTITSIFTLQIIYIINRNDIGSIQWIGLQDLGGIPDAVLLLCLINITFAFSNLFVLGIQWARYHKTAFSWGFSIVLYLTFAFLMAQADYDVWIKAFSLFLLVELLGCGLLMQRFAHLDG